MSVEIARKLLDGETVEKTATAETIIVKGCETAKANRYEYKSDCALSY